jgi:hypothetical protein
MAMIRLPTSLSRGRANLHQGAVGAGIDLRTGRTFGGVHRNRSATVHPDTGVSIAGFQIPHWPDFLRNAVNLSDGVQLEYFGVDFVVDDRLGPVVLEANARPGLAIQVANRTGLLPRLRYIDRCMKETRSAEERLEIVRTMGSTEVRFPQSAPNIRIASSPPVPVDPFPAQPSGPGI